MAFSDKVAKTTGFLDFWNWVWFAVQFATGLTGAAVMAWLVSKLSWFWDTFEWAGVVAVGLVVWLLIGLGLNLYRRASFKNKEPRPTDDPIQVISGKHFRNEVVVLDGHEYHNCTFTNVTFKYDGSSDLKFTHNNIIGQPKIMSDSPVVERAFLWMHGFGMLRENMELISDTPLHIVPIKVNKPEKEAR